MGSLQLYFGHERLDTTQLDTHLSPDQAREVHEQTHPTGNKHQPKESKDETDEDKSKS